jgi:hypothetical protein
MTHADVVTRILAQLDEVRVRCPEFRFGQLIAAIGTLAEDETGSSLWDVEDADFLSALNRFASDMAGRDGVIAEQAAPPDRGGIPSSPASTAS